MKDGPKGDNSPTVKKPKITLRSFEQYLLFVEQAKNEGPFKF